MLRSETAANAELRAAALAGLRRYQEAARAPPRPPRPEVARVDRAAVRDGGGVAGPPVLLVPSVINPPDVLDLRPGRSLVDHLADAGLRPLLLDWGTPGAAERGRTLAGHVEELLLPLLQALGEPVALAGYCLGGTLALAAAARAPTRGVALIAAPWRFGGYPDAFRAGIAQAWAGAAPLADALGLLPMEALQTAFWRLDPARTIAKYARLGRAAPDPAALAGFVRLEDWANDGPPLPAATARELFEQLFAADRPGRDAWVVAGAPVRPAELRAPLLDIVSAADRIVPAAAALGRGERLELALGHVGMVVGGRAEPALWRPLARWLSRLPRA